MVSCSHQETTLQLTCNSLTCFCFAESTTEEIELQDVEC